MHLFYINVKHGLHSSFPPSHFIDNLTPPNAGSLNDGVRPVVQYSSHGMQCWKKERSKQGVYQKDVFKFTDLFIFSLTILSKLSGQPLKGQDMYEVQLLCN